MSAKLRILYIEDDPLDSMAIERLGSQDDFPHEIIIADSIASTKSILETKTKFDLVLADFLLSDGNAFEIFDFNLKIPIIFLTGSGDEEVAIKAMKLGAYDYLIKDSDRNYLKILPLTIDNVMEKYWKDNQIKILETSVNNAQDAFLICEANDNNPLNSKIIFNNEGLSKIIGFSNTEIWEMGLEKLFLKGNNEFVVDDINRQLKKRIPLRSELILIGKNDQKAYIEANFVPIIENDGVSHILIIARDITLRKNNEKELIKAKIEADEARRAEEYFLAVMSHEIRTPINSVVGLVDLLFDTQISLEQADYLSSIKTSANSLLSLLTDILDLSRIEQGNLTTTSTEFRLEDVIKNAIKSLKFSAEDKGLDLSLTNDIDMPTYVKGDPIRLNQIITNLLNNAIKFTEKGEVRIITKVLSKNEKTSRIQIQVIDTGIGIPEDKLQVIFQKYRQADQETLMRYGGTGLGLYIVQELVKLQNGTIEVESEVGKGTKFSFDIEFGNVRSEYVVHSPFKKRHNLKGKKVLVGEDNLMNRKIVVKMLEKWDIEAKVLNNGQKILEELHKNTDYDLLLIDLQMPILDGRKTIITIREELQLDLKIVLMTASVFKNKYQDVLELIDGLIQKPFDSNQLYNQLCICLDKQFDPNREEEKAVPSSELPKYDLTFLQKTSNNNREFVREMVEIFITQVDTFLLHIPDLLKEKDFDEIAKHAHTIKSSARHIGNPKLFYNCEKIESLIFSKDPRYKEKVPDLLQEFAQESNATKDQLQIALEEI